VAERRCTFKCGDWNCGSYQFNLYKADIDQGDLCDVHYWQTKAQRKWVGLTDEETRPIIHKAMVYYGYDPEHATLTSGAGFHLLAESIEQLLKEKNT